MEVCVGGGGSLPAIDGSACDQNAEFAAFVNDECGRGAAFDLSMLTRHAAMRVSVGWSAMQHIKKSKVFCHERALAHLLLSMLMSHALRPMVMGRSWGGGGIQMSMESQVRRNMRGGRDV